MKKMNRKGFTIVELVIVIAVIAILAAVLIPTFSGITNRAKESARIQETRNAMTEYLAEQKNGTIKENTEFYYFETAPTATATDVETYKFTYANGKLTAPSAATKVSVDITTTTTGEGATAVTTPTYEIADAAATPASGNNKVWIVVPADNN